MAGRSTRWTVVVWSLTYIHVYVSDTLFGPMDAYVSGSSRSRWRSPVRVMCRGGPVWMAWRRGSYGDGRSVLSYFFSPGRGDGSS